MITYNPSPKVFGHAETMIKSLYEYDPHYKNTVIVFGYSVIKGGIETIKNKYPNKRIIVYQLEQMFDKCPWLTKNAIKFMLAADEVWDYDHQNIQFLKRKFNIKSKFIPLQFTPELNIIPLLPEKDHDIDILFYGSIKCDRRMKIIDDIKKTLPDKNIIIGTEMWGDELNDHIQRAKIILNIHFFNEYDRLEQVRLFFPLSNHKCIVSEYSEYNYYKNGISMTKKENIPERCKELLETGKWMKYAKESVRTLILSNEYFKE